MLVEDKKPQIKEKYSPTNSSKCDGAEWDKASVAGLSQLQISQFSPEEMVRVIYAANMSLLRFELDRRLEFYDRQTLERLVYLARRCCRNQGY